MAIRACIIDPKIHSHRNALHQHTYNKHLKFKHLKERNIITLYKETTIMHLILHFFFLIYNYQNHIASTLCIARAFNTNFSILCDILNYTYLQPNFGTFYGFSKLVEPCLPNTECWTVPMVHTNHRWFCSTHGVLHTLLLHISCECKNTDTYSTR